MFVRRSSFFGSLDDKASTDARFQVSSNMTDSDRELYFSDHVLELQMAEDEKRRRIRDARRRAEKAQREKFRDDLRQLAVGGTIIPSSRWRNVEEFIVGLASYEPVKEQRREVPREILEDFVEEWDSLYRRDKSFLSDLVYPPSNKALVVSKDMAYETFTKALLDQAAYSADVYSTTRQILNHADPVSSARIYFKELIDKAKESSDASVRRQSRRRSQVESSEDEGEIIEDGEIDEKPKRLNESADEQAHPKASTDPVKPGEKEQIQPEQN